MSAPPVLHRRGGRAAVAVSVGWLLAFLSGSLITDVATCRDCSIYPDAEEILGEGRVSEVL